MDSALTNRRRRRFAQKTYTHFFLLLFVAIIQWIVICSIEYVREVLYDCEIICTSCFVLAICLFTLFTFFEKLRLMGAISILLSLIIVELEIISLFVLIVRSCWSEILIYYLICAVVVVFGLFIACCTPLHLDITRNMSLVFVLSYILIFCSVYFLMSSIQVKDSSRPIAFCCFNMILSATMFMFVVFYGQSIEGKRYARMNPNNHLMASLMLFHLFLIMYLLTFFWQIQYNYFTFKEVILDPALNKQLMATVNDYKDYSDELPEIVYDEDDSKN